MFIAYYCTIFLILIFLNQKDNIVELVNESDSLKMYDEDELDNDIGIITNDSWLLKVTRKNFHECLKSKITNDAIYIDSLICYVLVILYERLNDDHLTDTKISTKYKRIFYTSIGYDPTVCNMLEFAKSLSKNVLKEINRHFSLLQMLYNWGLHQENIRCFLFSLQIRGEITNYEMIKQGNFFGDIATLMHEKILVESAFVVQKRKLYNAAYYES